MRAKKRTSILDSRSLSNTNFVSSHVQKNAMTELAASSTPSDLQPNSNLSLLRYCMKTVLFSSAGEAGRPQLATVIFNSLCAPAMVKAVCASAEGCGEFRPEVSAALQEIGLDASEAKALSPASLSEVHLLVTFGAADPVSADLARARREDWAVPSIVGQSPEQVSRIRDQISKKVWRLIAKEGWYRLQPATSLRFKPAALGTLASGAAFRAS